jgi:hypothetical protein
LTAALLAIAAVAVATRFIDLPAPRANPPGRFAFGAFGDAPYDPLESARIR